MASENVVDRKRVHGLLCCYRVCHLTLSAGERRRGRRCLPNKPPELKVNIQIYPKIESKLAPDRTERCVYVWERALFLLSGRILASAKA